MKNVSENNDDKINKNNNNKSKITYTVNIRGLSSVMTNKKYESNIPENTPEPETSAAPSTGDDLLSKEATPQPQSQQAPSSGKSKKNKKKGKKR
ncbi:unnamed protein product [[Candida] boidinii]|nr:unnamed protein product [[Candida] boidinii]